MKDSKYYKKKFKKKLINEDKVSKLLSQFLLAVIFVLGSLIVTNFSNNIRRIYADDILNRNMSFSSVNNFYNKYIGGKKNEEDVVVANYDINDKNYEKVNDSYKFKVGSEYPVTILSPGIIVYIGDKDELGSTVIVQGNDGIDIWYSNVYVTDYSIYDYVSKDTIIGVNNDDYYMITIMKDGQPLAYEEYFI